ncbi:MULTISPECIES: HdeD family acid-resistance protein [Marinobacter]|uniref:HdeD family acid-resistance protein n=1 Tax=Marinobacter xiaoshiensis TaxID=3073652 RepID=A0ABU2HJ57_9GAMM|nr:MULTISPECIES: HdeD family acid-resistance protein [unclassified Marinobacter]MBK1873360.1 HdeD family acid-resistance protein [Marinobacter sp. 1-3A]MBK1886600.1 HdeD family acid-resistance protein [Marinobacter sp. DY40_1A1]MDS1310798.1 HdeD family acid-resistance protein [Marinobacter sp. F60267]
MSQSGGSVYTKSQLMVVQGVVGDLSKHWGWLLALGILFIVLGTVALGMSVAVTVATVLFFGVLLAIGGVFQIIEAFKCRGWKSILMHVLIALLYIVAGVSMITEPVAGSLVLTALLGGVFVATGLLRIVMGYHLKGTGLRWGWMVFAGVVSLVLGGMIFFQWPMSALWVIGLLIAIEMIFHGWAYVMIALALKTVR